MSYIQAIPTSYGGRKYRSRLEAKWALIFDNLGIKYEYEEQGYIVGRDGFGVRYLPDFVLYGGSYRCPKKLYVEVKGNMTIDSASKIKLFSERNPLYIVGAIPTDLFDPSNGMPDEYGFPYYNFLTVDGDYYDAVLGAKKGGGWGLFGTDYFDDMDVVKTEMAYSIARQARFEYGETPEPPLPPVGF